MAFWITASDFSQNQPNHFTHYRSKSLVVVIANEPTFTNSIIRFEVEVIARSTKVTQGKLLIALKTDSSFNLNYGDLLLIPANYYEVEPPYNPDEFDFKSYLKSRKIAYQCFINQQQVKKIGSNFGNPLIGFALSLRKRIVDNFKQYIQHQESAAIASTLIMGYRANLSPELLSAYSGTGTLHVLSVSGMHVALVFLMFSFLLKPFDQFKHGKSVKTVLLVLLIWFYALITGFSSSVNRAALMLSFPVLGKLVNKQMNTYNLLALSAFLLLIIDPMYLFDIGFLLSYLAVLGLVWLHPHLYNLFYFKSKVVDAIWNYAALSIAAQAITFPLSIYIFHQFPIYFLISNMIIALPAAFIMYAGIGFVLLLPIKQVLPYLGLVLDQTIGKSNLILNYIEHLPLATIQGIYIDKLQLLLLYLFLILLIFSLILNRKKLFVVAISSCLLFFTFCVYDRICLLNQEKIVFYSLRKNTAIAYQHFGKIELISDLKAGDKAYQFFIKPSISKSGLQIKNTLSVNQNFEGEHWFVKDHFIQFGSVRVLRWTPDYDYKSFSKMIKVDVLLLSYNPKISLKKLVKQVNFSRLLIDGTNKDFRIKRWLDESAELSIECAVLKKNPAVILEL